MCPKHNLNGKNITNKGIFLNNIRFCGVISYNLHTNGIFRTFNNKQLKIKRSKNNFLTKEVILFIRNVEKNENENSGD
jgi:hypothetical protein